MKHLAPATAAAAAVFIAGPALAVDYVQCNAMRVAYDREVAALVAQRTMRQQAGRRVVIQRCGLSPGTTTSTAEQSAYEACMLPAYEAGVQQWDADNGELDPKTGKSTGSRYALNAVRILTDMTKNKCPMP
jgi:hypothetical protein